MTNAGFEESLNVFFEKRKGCFDTKKELQQLLSNAGYRRKKIDGVTDSYPVSDKQIDFAWDFFRSKIGQSELPAEVIRRLPYTEHKDKRNRNQLRSAYEQEHGGKIYKKGWFFPRIKK